MFGFFPNWGTGDLCSRIVGEVIKHLVIFLTALCPLLSARSMLPAPSRVPINVLVSALLNNSNIYLSMFIQSCRKWKKWALKLTEKVSWKKLGKFGESRHCLPIRLIKSMRKRKTPSRKRGRRSTGRAEDRRKRWQRFSRLQICPQCCCWKYCLWQPTALSQNLFLENSLSWQMSPR